MSVLASLLIAALLIVLEATQSLAGRPLVVDDAAPVAPGHLELEFGFSHARPAGRGREQAWPVMTVAYGVIEPLEIGVGIQRVNINDADEAPMKGSRIFMSQQNSASAKRLKRFRRPLFPSTLAYPRQTEPRASRPATPNMPSR